MGNFRRTKRKMERDVKKKRMQFNLPTNKEIEEYINKKVEELKNGNTNKPN